VLPTIVLAVEWLLMVVFVLGNTINSMITTAILLLMYPVFLVIRRLVPRIQSNS